MKLAILDDYQRVALRSADWTRLQGVEVSVFDQPFSSLDDAARSLEPFDIVCLMRERTPFPRALIERLPKLKFISLTGLRAGSLDSPACRERGIPISHTGAGNGTAATAELTWGLIIGAARGLAQGDRNMRSGRWHEGLAPGMALGGKRLGLLGLGKIGSRIAAIGSAFGMEVVGANQLAKMKPTAILVNVSRGPIVNEEALISALRAGRPGHAALDVYGSEPLPADHPLRQLDNVTLSPHLGYVNEENYRMLYSGTVENVAAWLEGKPVRLLE